MTAATALGRTIGWAAFLISAAVLALVFIILYLAYRKGASDLGEQA